MIDYIPTEKQKTPRMRFTIESSLRWNDVDRRFYQALYAVSRDERHLQQYYRALHQAIMLRGRHCPHYKTTERSSQ